MKDDGERDSCQDDPRCFERLHRSVAQARADPGERTDDHDGAQAVARTAQPGYCARGEIDPADDREEHDLPRRADRSRIQNRDLDRTESQHADREEQHGEYRRPCASRRSAPPRRAARHLERRSRHLGRPLANNLRERHGTGNKTLHIEGTYVHCPHARVGVASPQGKEGEQRRARFDQAVPRASRRRRRRCGSHARRRHPAPTSRRHAPYGAGRVDINCAMSTSTAP